MREPLLRCHTSQGPSPLHLSITWFVPTARLSLWRRKTALQQPSAKMLPATLANDLSDPQPSHPVGAGRNEIYTVHF